MSLMTHGMNTMMLHIATSRNTRRAGATCFAEYSNGACGRHMEAEVGGLGHQRNRVPEKPIS